MINLFKKLAGSEAVRDHLADFRRLTGLSASFRCGTGTDASPESAVCQGPFCALIHQIPAGEALCRCVQCKAETRAHRAHRATRVRCPFGLSTVAIPVTVRGDRVGTIFAGEVLVRPPDEAKWHKRLVKCLGEAVHGANIPQLWNAYCQTPVLTRGQFRELSKAFEGIVADLTSVITSPGQTHPAKAEEEIDQAIAELQKNPDGESRVKAQAAERILLENLTAHIGKHVRYLRLKNLGLGIYSVRLADPNAKPQTMLLK